MYPAGSGKAWMTSWSQQRVVRTVLKLFIFMELFHKHSLLLVLPILYQCCSLVAKSCPTLCNPKDCSPSGSSVHGILQASILEWVAISSSRGSSWLRDRTCISCLAGRSFLFPEPSVPIPPCSDEKMGLWDACDLPRSVGHRDCVRLSRLSATGHKLSSWSQCQMTLTRHKKEWKNATCSNMDAA